MICVLFALNANGTESFNKTYTDWNTLSIDSIYNLGEKFLREEHRDSALICFTICGNKANSDLSQKLKSKCVKSLTNSARLYFCFYDYEKACDQLIRAIKLCDESEMSQELTGIYMEQGALMMTYAQQRPKAETFQQAEEAYRKAFWNALNHKQYSSLITAFFNLGNRFYSAMKLHEMENELHAFKIANIPQTEPSYEYIINFHQALCNINQAKYSEARKCFKRQLEYIPNEFRNNILRYQVFANITKTFIIENNIDSAIYYENKMYDIASRNELKDAKTLSASALSELYTAKGDSVEASKYSFIALQLKDSLLSVNNLDEVKSLDFIQRLHEEEKRINNYKNHNLWLTLSLTIATLIIIIILFYWIKSKRGFKEIEKKDTENRHFAKYENSSLEDSAKQDLKTKIKEVLSDNETIFKQDFCLSQLAEHCNSNTKYVSQVINESYEQNFATLINTLRIQEACRRIDDKENYGSWTLEGISQSVGFKSRVTFYNTFKKHMGMSPSEYHQRQNQ